MTSDNESGDDGGRHCLACETPLVKILSLGQMPLANALLDSPEPRDQENRVPLDVGFCPSCTLVQLLTTVPPAELFHEYPYFSSNSQTMLEHSEALVRQVQSRLTLDESDLVIEVASNDGYLLKNYVELGIPCLGIEPAENIAMVAESSGVPTLSEFFDTALAKRLEREERRATVIHANNVMAHVPSINDFVTALRIALRPTGSLVIETPYVRNLVDGAQFDTIYHEHVFYYSLHSLTNVLERNGLFVYDVERVQIHGGSLRVFASSIKRTPSDRTSQLRGEEKELALDSAAYYRRLADKMQEALEAIRQTIQADVSLGSHIAAYGAGAKGAVLLNLLGSETTRHIEFVADRSPAKQGRYLPGVHLPVVGADQLVKRQPDLVLLLTWNFADEILEQQQRFRDQGGRFLVPLPSPVIV